MKHNVMLLFIAKIPFDLLLELTCCPFLFSLCPYAFLIVNKLIQKHPTILRKQITAQSQVLLSILDFMIACEQI